jgi:hypothetical protein
MNYKQISKPTARTRKVRGKVGDNYDYKEVSATEKESEKRRQPSIKTERKISVNKSPDEKPKERRRFNREVGDQVAAVAGGDNPLLELEKKVPGKETKEVRRPKVKPPVAMRKSQKN